MTTSEPYPALTQHGRWFILIGLLTLLAFGLRTITHSDFWLTLSCGRWIAEHGIPHSDPFSLTRGANAPWMDTAWLYNLLTYQIWSWGGPLLVTLTHIAGVLLAFLLLVCVARRFGGPIPVACALLVSAWLMAPAFMARARVLALCFPALFIFGLLAGDRRWWSWLILLPAQVLWANIHHTFWLGPVICLIFFLEKFLQERQPQRGEVGEAMPIERGAWLNPLFLALGTLVATAANPYGWEVYRTATILGFASTPPMISEEVSVFGNLFGATGISRLIWLAVVVNLMGLVAEKQRLPFGITVLALMGTGLALLSPHYSTVLAVFSFPFFVLSFRAVGCFVWDAFSEVVHHQPRLFARCVVAGLLLIPALTWAGLVSNCYYYTTGSASAFGLGVNDEAFPVAAAPVLARTNFPAVAINQPLDGGCLLWHLPQRPVFIDARLNFYGPALMQLVNRGLAGDMQAWRTLENRFNPGAVLINCCYFTSPHGDLQNIGLKNLLATGYWRPAYFDGTCVVLLRATPENRALLQDPQIKLTGLTNLEVLRRAYERRIATRWFPTHSPALLGAGSYLMTIRQYGDAEKVFELLVRGAPHVTGAWLDLGVCRWYQGRLRDALTALSHVTRDAPRNAWGWLWYGQTCKQLDMAQEADEAFRRAQKLNPVLAAAFADEMQTPAKAASPKKTSS